MGNFKLFLGLIKSRKMKIGSSRPRMFLGNKLVYPLPISAASVTCNSAVYNGSKQVAQNIVVKLNGETLDGTLDYTVTVNNGGTNVGSYPVTVLGINNFDSVANGTFSITPDVGRVTTAPSPKNLTYNATAQELVTAGSGTGTMMYSLNNSTWSASIPKGTNATSYTVYYKAAASANYTESSVGSVNVSIAKVTPTVTPPSRKSLTYNGNPQAIANTGSTNYGTLQYSLDNSNWSTSMPTRTDTGTYTLYYRVVGNANINDVPSDSIETSIGKADPSYTAPTKRNFTYNGNAQNLLNAGSTSHGTIQYSINNSTWSTTIPTATNVGTYNAWWRLVGDRNHNDVQSTKISDITVSKVTPTVTAPTPKTLTFNTSEQVLANNGATNFGTIQYSLNNSTWSNSVPSASAANVTYKVYYKVVGNSNINDWPTDGSSPYITCSIAEKRVTTPTIELNPTSYIYDGNACRPAVTVKDGTTVIPSSEYTVTYSNNINAGDATVTISDNTAGNYYISGTTTFNIAKRTPTVTAPTPKTNLVFNGSAQALINAGTTSHGTMQYSLDNVNYSTTIPSGTNAKSYTVWYRVVGNSNINDYGPYYISSSIAKAQGTATVTGTTNTYDGTAKNLVTVNGNTGTMHYKVNDGGWSTTLPQATNAGGPWTIYWSMDESTNYTGIPSASTRYVTSSISKASQAAPTATGATTTYDTIATATAGGGGGQGSLEWESAQSQTSVGYHNTRARWSGNGNYYASDWSNSVRVEMTKASRTLSWVTEPTDIGVGDSISIAASPSAGSSDGTITYTSSDSNIASIEGNNINGVSMGTCIITATISEGTNYLSASVSTEIEVYGDPYNGHDYVKIGGIEWATMNIGATSVTDYGQYFQWGDTAGYLSSDVGSQSTAYKKPFTWNDYKFDNGSNGQATGLTKYNSTDNKTSLEICDDAARAYWRGSWRMPTKDEFEALGNAVNAAFTENYQGSGVRGIVCTDKTDSSKVLFFPSAGVCFDGSWGEGYYGEECYYWHSSLNTYDVQHAYVTVWKNNEFATGFSSKPRYYGCSIRAVVEKKKANPNILTAPTGRVGLVYNGNLQYLLEGGTADVVGTFDYERQTNAGTYNALWTFYPTDSDNYNTVKGTITVSIAKLTPTITATPTAKSGLKYNGNAQELLEGGTANVGGTFTYSTASTVGTHTASWTFTPTDTSNCNTVTGGGISVTISKGDGTATVVGLTSPYNGSSRELVTAYNNTGTLHYRLGSSGAWSTEKPTAIEKGTYYVYWYMDTTSNYNGLYSSSNPASVTSYISEKLTPNITTTPSAKSGLVYNGSAQELLSGGAADVPGTFTYSTGVNAGSYTASWTFTPTDTTNYNVVNGGGISASIGKANVSYTAPNYSDSTYDGNSHYIMTTGSISSPSSAYFQYSANGSSGWSTTRPTAVNAGQYYPYYRIIANNSNYNDVGATRIASRTDIYKADQSAPTAYGESVGCGSSASATASGGGGQGSLEWSNGSSRSDIGSQDTQARWGGNSNYNASSWSNVVTLTVSMNSQSAPTAYGSVTNCPNTATATASGGGEQGSLEWESEQSQTSVGSHSTRARWSGNGCYNASPWSNYVTVQMDKNTQSAPTVYGSSTTYPTTATASATGGGGQGSLEWESAQSQTSVGSHTTRARWTGNDCYYASDWSNTVSVSMGKASRSLTWTSSTNEMTVGNTIALSVNVSAGSSDGTLVYSSSDTSKASINGSTLTAVGAGTSVITASITGGTNYENASTSFTLTVKSAAKPKIVVETPSSSKRNPQVIFYNTSNQSECTLGSYIGGGTFEVTWAYGGTVNKITWSNNTSNIPYLTILDYNDNVLLDRASLTGSYGTLYLGTSFNAGYYQENCKTLYLHFTDV